MPVPLSRVDPLSDTIGTRVRGRAHTRAFGNFINKCTYIICKNTYIVCILVLQ